MLFFLFFYIYGFCAHALDYHGDEKMAPGSFLLDMLNRSKEQGELVAETETRSAVFVARRPSVRARMASCPFDDPPSWWMAKKCVPDQKLVTRWEGDGEEAYEVPLFSSSSSSSSAEILILLFDACLFCIY